MQPPTASTSVTLNQRRRGPLKVSLYPCPSLLMRAHPRSNPDFNLEINRAENIVTWRRLVNRDFVKAINLRALDDIARNVSTYRIHLTSTSSTILIPIPATLATHELVPCVLALLLPLPDLPSPHMEYRNFVCGPAQIPLFPLSLYIAKFHSSFLWSLHNVATLNIELQS